MALELQSNHGDPLLSAAMKHWESRAPKRSRDSLVHEDPVFSKLMKEDFGKASARSALPLHSYYSEFRLGQGDPLLKAAMEQWPCTTVEGKQKPVELPKSRALTLAPCKVLVDPTTGRLYWSTINDILHMDNVGHLDTTTGTNEGERRFILLSDDRRFVLVTPKEEEAKDENKDESK